MQKRYIIRYAKTSYLEVEVSADSMDEARRVAKHSKDVFDIACNSTELLVQEYPSREDMICRVSDKGERAYVPLDDDDNEIDQVEEFQWGR